jgi:hypothetical protein
MHRRFSRSVFLTSPNVPWPDSETDPRKTTSGCPRQTPHHHRLSSPRLTPRPRSPPTPGAAWHSADGARIAQISGRLGDRPSSRRKGTSGLRTSTTRTTTPPPRIQHTFTATLGVVVALVALLILGNWISDGTGGTANGHEASATDDGSPADADDDSTTGRDMSGLPPTPGHRTAPAPPSPRTIREQSVRFRRPPSVGSCVLPSAPVRERCRRPVGNRSA